MVRDLADVAIRMVEEEQYQQVHDEAFAHALERILDALEPSSRRRTRPSPNLSQLPPPFQQLMQNLTRQVGEREDEAEEEFESEAATQHRERLERLRSHLRQRVIDGEYDHQIIEIEVEESRSPVFNIWSGAGEEIISMQDALGGMMPKQRRTRQVTVYEAREILTHEEAQKLVDRDTIIREAIDRVENDGIIFIDELDKVAHRETSGHGPDVSREGVQRDILPVVEGSTVMTKYGPVNTAHILFIAAGAFHVSKPSDLIPELQGRFPIRVELKNLTRDDLKEILVEPRNALLRQYQALLGTEGVEVEFQEDAIEEIADIAARINEQSQNIGARRLYTVVERLLDELSFTASDLRGQTVTISCQYVRDRLSGIVEDTDLSRYIL
jgi:ATP-dependent HslUV protease ATP-binding subunit HslU